MLAGTLRQCQEISAYIWPPQPVDEEDDSDYQPTIENITGLSDKVEMILRSFESLPPHRVFATSHLARRMQEAIKLTRHSFITQASPFTKYLASKGAIEWETEIRRDFEQSNAPGIVPEGWKAVSDVGGVTKVVLIEDDEKEDKDKPKKSRIFSSFFSRQSESTEQPQPPNVNSNAPVNSSASVMESSIISKSSISSVEFASPAAATAPMSPMFRIGSSQPGLEEDLPLVAAPSVVSRFLTRFSRSTTTSMRLHTRALSDDDDVAYMEDLVPSLMDDEDGIDALASMISSPAPAPAPLGMASSPATHTTPLAAQRINANTIPLGLFDPIPPENLLGSLIHTTPAALRSDSRAKNLTSHSGFTPPPLLPPPKRSETLHSLPIYSEIALTPPLLPPPHRGPKSRSLSNRVPSDDDADESHNADSTEVLILRSETSENITPSSSKVSDQPLIEAAANPANLRTVSINSDFDDFDNFVSQPSYSPSPPPPPAKSPRYISRVALNAPQSQHEASTSSTSRGLLFIASTDSDLHLSSIPTALLASPPLVPNMSRDPKTSVLLSAATNEPKSQGGLSAQDLSFFEGL